MAVWLGEAEWRAVPCYVHLAENRDEDVDDHAVAGLTVGLGIADDDPEVVAESHESEAFPRREFSDAALVGYVVVHARTVHLVHRLE